MSDSDRSALLDAVHVVLVEPRGPRNVGAVARTMVNFGLRHLRMVGGPPPSHPEVTLMAVKAQDVLAGTRRSETLEEALDDLTYVVGTTARRRGRQPAISAREAAALILEQAAQGRVGIVFGPEDRGLTSADLRRTHEVIAIEASPRCRALNLSQAAAIVAYEVFLASQAERQEVASDPGRLVTGEMATLLESELTLALEVLGIVHEGTRVAYAQSLARLLSLGPMQTRDARLLFALARRIKALEAHLLPHRGAPRGGRDLSRADAP